MPTRRQFLQTGLLASTGFLWGAPDLLAASPRSGETSYKVKKGDTLSAIAKRSGTTVKGLQSRNKLKGDKILIGQHLIIPNNFAAHSSLAPVIAATRKINVTRSRWRYIVIHHSAIEAGNARAYDSNHRRRGMENGLAYHFVIGNGRDSGNGEIEIGPRWTKQLRGGHVRSSSVNNSGIGICLVGNFEKRRPSRKQLDAAFHLVDYLRDSLVHPKCKVTVHRWVDLNHTVCPGKHFPFSTLKRRYNIA
jgi:LysM repeat protein